MHRLTKEEADEVVRKLDGKTCAGCGSDRFAIELEVLKVPSYGSENSRGLQAIATICRQCGLLSLHHLEVIAPKVQARIKAERNVGKG